MSKLVNPSAKNRWHAEILYSLFKQKVTLAELQGIATQMRYLEILKSLPKPGMVDELPELAERCALMPELLEGGQPSDPDKALRHLTIRCAVQDVNAETIAAFDAMG